MTFNKSSAKYIDLETKPGEPSSEHISRGIAKYLRTRERPASMTSLFGNSEEEFEFEFRRRASTFNHITAATKKPDQIKMGKKEDVSNFKNKRERFAIKRTPKSVEVIRKDKSEKNQKSHERNETDNKRLKSQQLFTRKMNPFLACFMFNVSFYATE